jgi:hypothetical protein
LAFPRCAIGARWLPESMNVAKLVMSRISAWVSSPNTSIIRRVSAASICSSCSTVTASIASQNRR